MYVYIVRFTRENGWFDDERVNTGASEHDSLVYGMSEDSGLGRATPPRRAASPGMAGIAGAGGSTRHLPSPSQPGSLPPGLITRRRPTHYGFDDAASDISTTSSMDFTGNYCNLLS